MLGTSASFANVVINYIGYMQSQSLQTQSEVDSRLDLLELLSTERGQPTAKAVPGNGNYGIQIGYTVLRCPISNT